MVGYEEEEEEFWVGEGGETDRFSGKIVGGAKKALLENVNFSTIVSVGNQLFPTNFRRK